MKKSITILAAMAALLTTSCSDELNGNDSYSNEFTQAVDTDLTCGVNVFLCSQDTIYDAHIPLSVNADVKAVAENKLVHLDCIRNTRGESYLQPSLASRQDTTVTTSVELSVPNHEDMNKTVIVSILPSELASRAATKDQVHERLTDVLSYGVYADLLPGEVEVEHPALNPVALKAHVENHQGFRMNSRTSKSYGTSVKELTENWNLNLGFQIPCSGIPLGKTVPPAAGAANAGAANAGAGAANGGAANAGAANAEAGAANAGAANAGAANAGAAVAAVARRFQPFQLIKSAFSFKESSNERHEKEYLMLDSHDYRAFGLLDDETATTEEGSDAWIGILSPRLNDLLHNPKKCEKAYPLTEDGAMALVAAFGSHIPTQALLGSGVRYETSKTIDVVDRSFGFGISFTGENYANNAGYDPGKANDAQEGITAGNASKFIAKAALMYASGGMFVASSGNVNFDKTKKDYAASTDQKCEIITIGNGSFSGDRWVAGSDPTDWQILGYGYQGKTMRQARLIPLYALISKTARDNDPDVEKRYRQLKAVIDAPSEKSYPKYLSYFGRLPEDENSSRFVICDFVLKIEKNKDGEPFVGSVMCKDGVKRDVMYYPLRWSNVAGEVGDKEWKYCTFDAVKNAFIVLGSLYGKKTHFYYAVIQNSLHDGIDAITFVPESSSEGYNWLGSNKNRGDDYSAKGWTRRTIDDANSGTNLACADADKVVPYVHYRNSKSRWPAISAVCLFEDTNRYILASSAGTEYDESNDLYTKNFNTFWEKGAFKKFDTTGRIIPPMSSDNWYQFISDAPGLDQSAYYFRSTSACAYGFYRPRSWVSQPHHIYVGYSFRKLPTTVATTNGKKVPLTALTPKKYE